MQAARRLYLYAMSGITLAVVGVGLATLLDVLIAGSGLLERTYVVTSAREQLSLAVAMLGVGIPVWAVHWWLIQRGMAPSRPDRDAERGSPIRALYLTLLLLITLVIWVNGAIGLIQGIVASQIPSIQNYAFVDPVSSASSGAVGLLIWLYHGLVRRKDLRAGRVSGAASWIPRLYLYSVALGSLLVALGSLSAVVRYALVPVPFDEGYLFWQALQSGIAVIAWGLVWFGHWRYADHIVGSDGWRGAAERESRTRVAGFIATIMATSAMSLILFALAVQEALTPLVVERPDGIEPVRAVMAAVISAVPWAVAWWAHARGLRREPMASDPLRALHQDRLESHGVAVVALAIGATGLGWLAGLAIDIVLGGTRTSGGFPGIWSPELIFWLPAAIVGLVAWAAHWRRVLARRHRDPADEANSAIRRAFLYLTLAGALIVALASAALILYRIFGTAIGAGLGGNAVSALSTPLGALAASVAVLAYHGLLLRADQARRAVQPGEVEPQIVVGPGSMAEEAVAAQRTRRQGFELVGPADADLDAALAAARAALPPGIEIVEAGA